MNFIQAILLGLVQGLGEYLPISSSAHLIIVPWAFKFSDPGLKYDVELHLGTLIAVVAYFWQDFFMIARDTFQYITSRDVAVKEKSAFNFRLFTYIVVATIPGAIAGKLLEKFADETFRSPLLIAFDMIVMGALLWFADAKSDDAEKDLTGVTLKMALIIGCSQALALIPGVSRSGITITTALLLGLERSTAARFSFYLAAPITFGAVLLKSKFFTHFTLDPIGLTGVVVSAAVGFLSIKFLMKLVQGFSYRIFCYYRFLFGLAVVILYFVRG